MIAPQHAKFFVNLLGADNAYFDDAHRIAYCYDATKKRHLPDGVLFPRDERDVSEILKYCNENGVKIVPRGAGSGFTGGALAQGKGLKKTWGDHVRHATPQAMRIAGEFGEALAAAGIVTVSGMAVGIDSAAHEGALRKQGGTVAVWGTGIDRVYPVANKALAHRIAEQGCVLSEFPLGTRPLAGNFPRRNRLIAALSSAVLVVEAALESGSLITARLAADMGREVFAVPGSIDNPHSKGCHALIKQGAKLTETLADILEECPQLPQTASTNRQTAAQTKRLPENESSEFRQNESSEFLRSKNERSEFLRNKNESGEHRQAESLPSEQPVLADAAPAEIEAETSPLLQAMGYDAVHPDSLAERLKLPAADVYAELTLLEINGQIAPLSGGRYQRIAPNRNAK